MGSRMFGPLTVQATKKSVHNYKERGFNVFVITAYCYGDYIKKYKLGKPVQR